jgi:methionine-rich copper-binding protein CopC
MRLRHLTLAFAAFALAAPQIASAHTELVASTPAANSKVKAPSTIVLKFEEPVVGAATHATLDMTSMPGMAHGKPMAITGFTSKLGSDRKTLTLSFKKPLSPGGYRVTWSAAGADTHHVTGNFSFTVQ